MLGESGPLALHVKGFAPRLSQQLMSNAIQAALDAQQILVVEAGTGVGKTYAYLVPTLLSGQKVIISTGTRHLQDQLYHRDLPIVQRSLGVGIEAALLKGRSNYLCLNRLYQAQGEQKSRQDQAQLHKIKQWSLETSQGDIAELAEIPEGAPIWSKATSTVDNCLGSECPDFNNCFLVKARRRAQEADIVVINHHLFFADMALKEEGFGEVLPSANAFILDEAHQLPETASRFFGQSVSTRQLQELTQDTVAAQLRDVPDFNDLRDAAMAVEGSSKAFRLALGAAEQRGIWQLQWSKTEVRAALQQLQQHIEVLQAQLNEVSEHSEDLEQCAGRCTALLLRLSLFQVEEPELILWFEATRRGFQLHATPLEVGELIQQYMRGYQSAWVFTSATLAVAGNFKHFYERMGITAADAVSSAEAATEAGSNHSESAQFDSPFDYQKNARLYLPPSMPEPQSPGFLDKLIEVSLPLLQLSQGRAFMLFTSYRALQYVADKIADHVDFPLFVQGEAPRSQLLDQFRDSGNGVLLGTSSFWEGVDIKGEALSCVIIDKLPFAAPNDPVLQARLNAIKQQGGNPFFDYQVPQAVIALKQGVGRLIRDVHDRGVLAIMDPRLKTKGYGRIFLQSLPSMPVTSQLSDIEAFFTEQP